MIKQKQFWLGMVAALCLTILIIDSKTVLLGAKDGIELVLRSAIPALFPFILSTAVLNCIMIGRRIPVMKRIGKLCGIPDGAESILLLGLLGGYPIGAKLIYDCRIHSRLDAETADRMMGFCSNAGPAFIIGIMGQMFHRSYIPFILWAIHIGSALVTGIILPGRSKTVSRIQFQDGNGSQSIIEKSIITMAVIATWIIIWKIVITILLQHIPLEIPATLKTMIVGLCELTNGCFFLPTIEKESVRFIAASCLLSTGGICIVMQTVSVMKEFGLGMYLPGKVLQTMISFVISSTLCYAIYPGETTNLNSWILLFLVAIIVFVIVIRRHAKNNGSISVNYDI